MLSSQGTTNQTLVPHQAIYLSGGKSSADEKNPEKISVRDCTVSNQEHAANLLQAYWPYFTGINSSGANSSDQFAA